jgi:signal transduction histidine kinase
MKRPLLDALLASAVVAFCALCFARFDTAERITHALVPWENIELDDLLLSSVLLVLAVGWFAVRRWREAVASERDKLRYVQRLEQLSGQLLQAEQDERSRLAAVLHDDIGQTLFACRLRLDSLAERLPHPELRQQLAAASALADAAQRRARELNLDLCPPALQDLGLVEALEWLVERSRERWQLHAQLLPSADWQRIPSAWHEPVFQSVSELLANAAKHAGASTVTIAAAAVSDRQLQVCVRDDGRGFQRSAGARSGFGLFSIERRMAWLGGRLSIESGAGKGTAAFLELPLTPV